MESSWKTESRGPGRLLVGFVSSDGVSLVYPTTHRLPLRREHRQLFGQEVAFDMRRFFAHKDQRAVVMYILGCMRLIDIYD